ncbi:MAG: electron transfer flavoprotein-ubiquinone oxidoreductase [Planctomycetota bacterium]|nr:electron transfer flavoprotein-ubiquinone oxidoreductase [Planctomycetota bacterium]
MADAREVLDVDVLFVGGGPAGLAGAYRLHGLIEEHNALASERGEATLDDPMVCVIEKGEALGSHIISGAVIDPQGFDEIMPDWLERGAPVIPVRQDAMRWLTSTKSFPLPAPPWMNNHGFTTGSLNRVVRWMEGQVEEVGVNVFAGFPAADLIVEEGAVKGVVTNDKGISASGEKRANFEPGMEIRAKVTVLCEGSRGHLTKRLVERFGTEGRIPQVYETGVKETWEVPGASEQAGRVLHTAGFPLPRNLFGGSFLYWVGGDLITLGLVVALEYEDPTFDIHEELQRFKTHPFIRDLLKGGTRISYGAKSLPAGGYWAMPQPYVDGCLLAGDALGTVNVARLKGIHLAMKSGALAAETALQALLTGDSSAVTLAGYEKALKDSWAGQELYRVRNFHQAMAHGFSVGGMAQIGLQLVTGGRGLKECSAQSAGHTRMGKAAKARKARPPVEKDGNLTFDKLTNLFHSGTKHEEDQPSHLRIGVDPSHCATTCREEFGNPCQYFCPASVYEMVAEDETEGGAVRLQVNSSNCVHCKTCDIMDPYQVIDWVTPEGGGPVYTDL